MQEVTIFRVMTVLFGDLGGIRKRTWLCEGLMSEEQDSVKGAVPGQRTYRGK